MQTKPQDEDASGMTGRYKRLERIGKGSYGKVYRSIDLKTNETVAIKKINFDVSDQLRS